MYVKYAVFTRIFALDAYVYLIIISSLRLDFVPALLKGEFALDDVGVRFWRSLLGSFSDFGIKFDFATFVTLSSFSLSRSCVSSFRIPQRILFASAG